MVLKYSAAIDLRNDNLIPTFATFLTKIKRPK